MKWLLDQIYGANAMGDPYYEFFLDASALIPWWYPILIASIAGSFILGRWLSRMQHRRHTVLAAVRVTERARRHHYR